LLMGWLWYLVMLTPVIGIVQVGTQAHADRYTYLPQIGINVAVTWLVAEWGAKSAAGRMALAGLATFVLAVLAVCAWKQTKHWKNNETVWTHALACTTDNYEAYFGMGDVLLQKGYVDEAITDYQNALRLKPDYEEVHLNLGNAFLQKGWVEDAIIAYQNASRIKPGEAGPHLNLGTALLQKGRVDEAITEFQNALRLKPDHADAHLSLGTAYLQKGRVDDAITEYESALQINPESAEAHFDFGNALRQKGKPDKAAAEFQSAVRIDPKYLEAHCNLGNVLMEMGKMKEAMPHFEQALQIAPADANIQNNLAWLLATSPENSLRDGRRAVELAEQAQALTGGTNAMVLRSLAAAYAEVGRFGIARETARKAIELDRVAGQEEVVKEVNGELKLYEAGRAFHSPAPTP
jgi:protein O-mannosyl-transferase